MKKKLSILLALTMLLSCTMPAFAQERQRNEETAAAAAENSGNDLTEPFDVTYEGEVDAGLYPYDDKTVLVKLGKKTSTLDVSGIAGIEYLFAAKDGYWYSADLAEGTTPKQAVKTLRDTDGVLLAEYNFLYETGATTLCDGEGFYDDIQKNPRHNDEWHLDSCGIQRSWHHIKDDWHKNPGGDSGIVVAVIDTGVDYDHEDLKNNMWVNTGEIPGDGIDNDGDGYVDDYYGVDIVAGKGNGDDDHGHGTHVAGIIAAANNNVGVVGIAYNAKIMAIKAGQASGNFLQTDICKAINYAVDHGADVINMSFGGSAATIAVQDALERAYTSCVLVAAAGNDGKPNEPVDKGPAPKPSYPAAYSFVLGVMSVDDWGVESSFTNYDVEGFNDVEYELYAPGNAITSTIPNNRYATWNGTSMAAPIVSGMAAVLRSVYNDPDMYPTKFIYGQLASTSGRRAMCFDPKAHGKHYLPKIVNLYDALTKTPNPEVSVSDYKTFDSENISKENNGDGTIDAGETIALGFELRNRWGMSKDTVVTIDALSQAGIANPYVEFSTDGKNFSDSASIDYGSVGTYSTKDCGKVMSDELWTGWENPFYVRVKKDAPNETILAINVNISCKNALNEKDRKTYSSEPVTINLIVKNGIVLPQVIKEDMTLTKDNYYIIQNSTVIEEGATVTVTEGANIQFWTNDSTDPYADNYIAGLAVKGTLNCIGTEEEPVKIFPSELMGDYRVEIYEQGNGEINYSHTNITNLFTGTEYDNYYKGFTKAENCEFSQNYKQLLSFRLLVNGKVISRVGYYCTQYMAGGTAENCAFYKMGSDLDSYPLVLSANCKNCIFVDSSIDFSSGYTYEDCVFYGNNNYWDSASKGGTSTMRPRAFSKIIAEKIVRGETSGKTYVKLSGNTLMLNKGLAKYLGGKLADIKNDEEAAELKKLGITASLGENADIIEISDGIRIEELSFAKQSINLDTSATYQLAPQIYPSTASGNKLLYFSSNTAVATVDENGLVTPVSIGTAKLYAFSEDMQVSGSIEIVVKNEVKVTAVKAPEKMQINIGETAILNVGVKPKNTTKTVKYESADESIASVDSEGNVTAVSVGETVIKSFVSNSGEEIFAETRISVVIPAEKAEFESKMVYVSPGEAKSIMPTVTPKNATNQNIVWDTSDEAICYVNENGELVGVSEGLVTVKARVENTDISAYITVCVSEEYNSAPETVQVRNYNYRTNNIDLNYIITADGQLWQWGNSKEVNYVTPKKLDFYCDGERIEVSDIAFYKMDDTNHFYCLLIGSDGSLYRSNSVFHNSYGLGVDCTFEKIADNVVKFLQWPSLDRVTESIAAVMADGSVMMFGYNARGMLGVGGSGQCLADPVSITLDGGEKVIDGYIHDNACSYLLTDSGNLYIAGNYYDKVAGTYKRIEYFEKILEGVTGIKNNVLYTASGCFCFSTTYSLSYYGCLESLDDKDWIAKGLYIENSEVYNQYKRRLNFDSKKIKAILPVREKYFIVTNSSELFTVNSYFGDTNIPELVKLAPISIETAPVLRESDTNLTDAVYDESGNITSAVLKTDKLVLGFNASLSSADNYDNIILEKNDTRLGIKKNYDLNDLTIALGGGFTNGEEYVLTIPANALTNDSSLTNEEITVTFTYQPDEEEPEETPTVPEEPKEEEPEGEEKHVHSFTTETVMPTLEADGKITNTCECGVVTETILPKLTERKTFTAEDFSEKYNEFIEKGYNTNVFGSAILNRLNDSDVTKWLRVTAPSGDGKYGFGGNWWGTTNSELINHQIVDYRDFISLGSINEGEILTEAPENTFPFVTEAYILDESGEQQNVISGGKVKFVVKFNRDMDTEYGARVYFGSTYPYGDYEISGAFTDARTWVGETTLKTVVENGYQFIKVTSGRTAADENGEHLKLYNDWARFGFEIDTTSAMAMTMQGYADNSGIHLEWAQDDYDTLAGYNVYRADSEDGNYVRINKTVIPSEENTYTDNDVVPGKKYYYTFTVVLTDVSSESKPAGKIGIAAKDTMAPNVYHSPVYTATTGSKVIISATISDNIGVQNAKLYYRTKGTDEWKTAEMTASNDKYTASIPSSAITLDGVQYYIAAFDGVNYTYAGDRMGENPYEITVYAAVESNAKGDVDGDGNITVLDALKLLRAIYDETLLTQEEFLRADINGNGKLEAVEALRILQYANKKISSVLW